MVGTLAGFLLGVAFAGNIETIRQWLQGLTGTELFSAEIYFLSHLPARIEAMDVVSVVAMGLVLSPRNSVPGVARGAARSGRSVTL